MNIWQGRNIKVQLLQKELNRKLFYLYKLVTGPINNDDKNEGCLSDQKPVVSTDQMFESQSKEINILLPKLKKSTQMLAKSAIIVKMDQICSGDYTSAINCRIPSLECVRHTQLLHKYTRKFKKLQMYYQQRRNTENALRSELSFERLNFESSLESVTELTANIESPRKVSQQSAGSVPANIESPKKVSQQSAGSVPANIESPKKVSQQSAGSVPANIERSRKANYDSFLVALFLGFIIIFCQISEVF